MFALDLRDGAAPPPVALVATDCDWSAVLFGDPTDPAGLGDSADTSGLTIASTPHLELRGSASEILLSLWRRSNIDNPVLREALGAIDLS